MRILPASDRAMLVETRDLDEAMRLYGAWSGLDGVDELVPGAKTVLVRFDPLRVAASVLAERLANARQEQASVVIARRVEIPVHYDGEDLDEVGRMLGVSAEEVVRRHLDATWRVAFVGFAPGFGYLVGADPLFDVARRSSPRPRVPAGSVGLAGTFTGVYPRESPGGWQLIGRTDARMWDLSRDPPALLSPGTEVRFVRAARAEVVTGAAAAASDVRAAEPVEGARIEVVMPALQLLVQDLGRAGHAGLGVSASGAADRTALRQANRAVGNHSDAAVLESIGAMTLRFRGGAVVAVTGAEADIVVVTRAGEERNIPGGQPFAVGDGDELRIGHPVRGLRGVLAVRGGIRAVPVLGSVASDTLAGLGPAPLRGGDVVGIGDPRSAPEAVDPHAVPRDLPAAGETVTLEITLGPRDDWFTPEAVRVLLAQEWEVTAQSDRVGIRLLGTTPLARAVAGELPSEGAVTGAIQVPPDGQPVLFLPDHPLTGGYPIIGAVTDRALDLAGQLPPGARIRFALRA